LCSNYLDALLNRYASNPKAEWAAKDSAVTLVIAIMQRGSTSKVKIPPRKHFVAFRRKKNSPRFGGRKIRMDAPFAKMSTL